ncbi:MAG TPA: hypothetical protein VLJ10_01280, partial [Candidatus Bathyarchaeia archaeon]|nr:hypothetical protein [Candidatus Bathyarchaeia archaeon]
QRLSKEDLVDGQIDAVLAQTDVKFTIIPDNSNPLSAAVVINKITLADQTMVTSRQPEDIKGTRKVGGIDLNPAFLDLKIKRDGNGIPLPMMDQPMQELMQIEGFVPVIINVTPVQNLPMLLGMDVEPTTDDQNEGYAKLSFYRKVDVYEYKFVGREIADV